MDNRFRMDTWFTEEALGVPKGTLRKEGEMRLDSLPTNPATLVKVSFNYGDNSNKEFVTCSGAVGRQLECFVGVSNPEYRLAKENRDFPSPFMVFRGFKHLTELADQQGEVLILALCGFDSVKVYGPVNQEEWAEFLTFSESDLVPVGFKPVSRLTPVEFSYALTSGEPTETITPDEPCVSTKISGTKIVANVCSEVELSEALLKAAYLLGDMPEAKEIKRTLLKYGAF